MKRLIATLGVMVLILSVSATWAGKAEKNAEKRESLDAMAAEVLEELFADSKSAKELSGEAYGYAVFSNLKVAIGISGGGGSGVAVGGGKRIYMKMGTGGIGFGIGAQKYSVIFFFEDEKHFTSFTEKGWQADTGAQAAAGDKGANAAATFRNGTAVFQMTEKGLMASADVTGTKYWQNDKLNK